jgi:hypothetical protein
MYLSGDLSIDFSATDIRPAKMRVQVVYSRIKCIALSKAGERVAGLPSWDRAKV